MRQVLFAVLVSAGFGAGLQALAEGDAGIEAVIDDQFADFRAGDLDGAYQNASPLIQSIFGSPENFGRMVQSGYPVIWGSTEVRYLGLRREAGRTIQRLMVRDGGGALQFFDYDMLQVDGVWRVNGVFPVATDQAGV